MNETTRKTVLMIGQTYPINISRLFEVVHFYLPIYGNLTESDLNAARLWVSADETNKELFIEIAKGGILNPLLIWLIETCENYMNWSLRPLYEFGRSSPFDIEVWERFKDSMNELAETINELAKSANPLKAINRNTKRQYRKSSRVI